MGVLGRLPWALVGVALAVAGCASRPMPTAVAPPVVALSFGTIVSIRPAVVRSTGGADLLGAVGGVGQAAMQRFAREREQEFIVHEDGAVAPISVVQGNEMQLRPGDRVGLTRDGRTRLRPASGS